MALLGDPNANPSSVAEGFEVQLLHHGNVCAVGKLKFVGGTAGQVTSWGKLLVKRGKCLVTITRVTHRCVRPPMSHDPNPEEMDAGIRHWNNQDVTLREVFEDGLLPDGNLIAWPTKRIRALVGLVAQYVREQQQNNNFQVEEDGQAETAGDDTAGDDGAEEDEMEAEGVATGIPDVALMDVDSLGLDTDSVGGLSWPDSLPDPLDVTATAVDPNAPRTRQHMGRFHVFDSMPASRDPVIKNQISLIRRLVIFGTIRFDLDDWNDMTKYLASERNTTDLDDVLDHFHFNREWWCRRVRVYPPPPEEGAKNIADIREFVSSSNVLRAAWSKQMEAYFDSVELMHKEGRLSECHDVEMFQWEGTDKHGLSLWLRRRGSNRSENIHQKMRVAFGPHGVGAEVGHYLLLLVTCRHNVSTGVNRNRQIDFGMPHHDKIDRTQLRMQQLFETDIFPRHSNQLLFKAVPDFVAVGIGPLNCDEKWVTPGDPDPVLKGDMLFLAKRMKLKGPPLNVQHPEERKLFNDYMADHPKPNMARPCRCFQRKGKPNYDIPEATVHASEPLHKMEEHPGVGQDEGCHEARLLWFVEKDAGPLQH